MFHTVFERAFRPFFLGGAVFALVAMALWTWQFTHPSLAFAGLSSVDWHAHEMIFGYALAIVTGFLLTAVLNWSGMNSAQGVPLAVIFTLWALARLGYVIDLPIGWIALFDLGFNAGLLALFAWPIIKKRLWTQAGLVGLFAALLALNALFYGQVMLPSSAYLSTDLSTHLSTPANILTAGLFVILAINLTMMARMIPFFTEKSLQLAPLKPQHWLDNAAMLGFLALMLALIIWPNLLLTSLLAWSVGALFAYRGVRWYHHKIWTQLLLWPLHLAYGFITLGLLLLGFANLNWLSTSLAIHALAAGGVGLLCSAMLARISLGHTQRSILQPPSLSVLGLTLELKWVFIALTLAAVLRVIFPLLFAKQTLLWIQLSQFSWMAGFALLIALYWKILIRPGLVKANNLF